MLVFVIESIFLELNNANNNLRLSLQTLLLTVIYLQRESTETLYKTRLWAASLLIIVLIIFYITGKK